MRGLGQGLLRKLAIGERDRRGKIRGKGFKTSCGRGRSISASGKRERLGD